MDPPSRRGTLALVGAGEFLDSMRAVDAALLARAGGNRVAILPTASTPDGPEVPRRWAEMGKEHFRALGAAAEAIMALDRDGCNDPRLAESVRAADLVYFSGGKPGYLLETLHGTAVWRAVMDVLARGGVLAGCSAGAMILGGWIPSAPTWSRPGLWRAATALVPQTVVLPHFDELPRWISGPLSWLRPRGSTLVGIDGGTALVGFGRTWEHLGRGRIVVHGAPGMDVIRRASP